MILYLIAEIKGHNCYYSVCMITILNFMLPNYQARSPFVLKHTTSLLASERSERDTYRGNTIENRGCLFIGERA